jgi:hypothetical protein
MSWTRCPGFTPKFVLLITRWEALSLAESEHSHIRARKSASAGPVHHAQPPIAGELTTNTGCHSDGIGMRAMSEVEWDLPPPQPTSQRATWQKGVSSSATRSDTAVCREIERQSLLASLRPGLLRREIARLRCLERLRTNAVGHRARPYAFMAGGAQPPMKARNDCVGWIRTASLQTALNDTKFVRDSCLVMNPGRVSYGLASVLEPGEPRHVQRL